MADFFADILKANTLNVMKFSGELLSEYYKNISIEGNYYIYGKGESGILLVVHADTVRKNNNLRITCADGKLINLNGILGADDRAGVYMAFKLIRLCVITGVPLPSILITNYEERGMIGCREFINDGHANSLNKSTNLVVGLDRAGYLEYVTYGVDIPYYANKYLKSHGFLEGYSSKTSDIKVLMHNCKVPCVNISIGYYNQHLPTEYLNISEYSDTFERMYNLLNNPMRGGKI